jgi:hypothetical protein
MGLIPAATEPAPTAKALERIPYEEKSASGNLHCVMKARRQSTERT